MLNDALYMSSTLHWLCSYSRRALVFCAWKYFFSKPLERSGKVISFHAENDMDVDGTHLHRPI